MRRMFSLKQLQEIADARVESLVEGGTLDNAKPIYEHIVSLQADSGSYPHTKITLVLFRNNDTPITKTNIAEVLTDINKRLPVDGYLVSESKVYNVSFISTAQNILGLANDDTTISLSLATILADTNVNFNDDIIKLN